MWQTELVRRRQLGTLCASLCLLWMAGCSHINHLREAQDAFNRAAEVENRALFNSYDNNFASRTYATGAQDLGQISAGYTAALRSLDELEKDTETITKLKTDRLYGNTLTLRALAYWRLKKYDEAKKVAEAALTSDLEKGSRDFAMMTALPGLAENDQAFDKIAGTDTKMMPDSLELILKKLNFADAKFCAADRTVATNHPIRVYLGLSALAALRNVVSACERTYGTKDMKPVTCFKGGDSKRDEKARAYYNRLVNDLKVPAPSLQSFVLGIAMANDKPEITDPCPK